MNKNTSPPLNCFTSFEGETDQYNLPENFTFPFYYEPHPLCVMAANELQHFLETQHKWSHNFGVDQNKTGPIAGKMFGVLVVENSKKELGYLKAFSGKIIGDDIPDGFVPHIFDLIPGNNFFEKGMAQINIITERIKEIESDTEFDFLQSQLEKKKLLAATEIESFREQMRASKKIRKTKRLKGKEELSEIEFQALSDELIKESLHNKFLLKELTNKWNDQISNLESEENHYYAEYRNLKTKRKTDSSLLQEKLFDQYQFLNKAGTVKSLSLIFATMKVGHPPAGSGDCAAPKLLQYAFKHDLTPVAMAEFWWGAPHKASIRTHGNFYPACTSKCQPILNHMLSGMQVDPNPMLNNAGKDTAIAVIFEDEYMAVINKPSGLLSVPGKTIEDSVAHRLKIQYPAATGPLIVHRLDQDTSGLMLIAKSKEIHKILQQQFIKRTIKKRYIALLEAKVEIDSGKIDLPLRVDLDNRPAQVVCYEHGKSAITNYQVLDNKDGKTRIHFHPVTGRTHQLRMHAAHVDGLNSPIIGDSLYGNKANRLHLHAEWIELHHPFNKKVISFSIEAPF